eukprot:Nitzschia sp. Nitz4//scaffold375_size13900//2924//4132//NITZ4_008964-RA/size13900-augustus-gene-0.9-mRNA-1//1//CDS//3329549639//165//frame0
MELLSKVTVGSKELKNRLVLPAMTRCRVKITDDPLDVESTFATDLMATYYEQRASAGLLVTEPVSFSEDGHGFYYTPQMRTQEHADSWKKVVDRVHAKDGAIFLQMSHFGRVAHSSFHPNTQRIVAPGDVPVPANICLKRIYGDNVYPETPHALTKEEIKETIQDYVQCAKYAQSAGFDGLEIDAGNSYLIDQFLQSCSNNRTDEYGGSHENRARFLKEIIEAIVESGAFATGQIGVLISPNSNFFGMGCADNYDMFTYLAETLNTFGLAYIHIMDGKGYYEFHGQCKSVKAMDIKKRFDGPVICNTGLNKETAEGMIRSGAADLASFGRLYISNPDLAERFANNWPVAPPGVFDTWNVPVGAIGYTDFPTYQPEEN